MRKDSLISLSIIVVTLSVYVASASSSRDYVNALRNGAQARITLQVIDTNGIPIDHATVSTGFYRPGPPKQRKVGYTNQEGFYSVEDITLNEMNYQVNKEGFYYTRSDYHWAAKSDPNTSVKDGKWQPWDPVVQVVLRPKLEPVSMYAKSTTVYLPNITEHMGYDLVVGDLVRPYGDGETSDFIFHVVPKIFYGRTGIDITFSNPNDGIQTVFIPQKIKPISEYNFPYNAPSDGYTHSLIEADAKWREIYRQFRHVSSQMNNRDKLPTPWYWTDYAFSITEPRDWQEEINYVFRIRSSKSREGLYGKIYGHFHCVIEGRDKPRIQFTYYLNPTGSRNIEFNVGHNLFKEFSRRMEYDLNIP